MYTIESAIQQKGIAEKNLLKISGVNAVDVGFKYVNGQRTDEISIRVHVTRKHKPTAKKDQIPAEINGIKTDVIEGTYLPQIVSKQAVQTVEALADTGRYRPLEGGISIGPDRVISGSVYAGTLGCFVEDNATHAVYMLSNFHVLCVDNGWSVGDQIDQPSRVDTGTPADGVGSIVRAVLSSHVDGGLADINSGIGHHVNVVGIGNIKGTASAVLNAPVRKRGRTTALTSGFVDGLNASVNVNYGDGIGVKTLTNQITIRPDTSQNTKFSDHGDSGSVVVNDDEKVVGLLFAGSDSAPYLTIANPIAFVENELNVTVLKDNIVKKLETIDNKIFKPELKERIKEKLEIKELKIEFKENKLEKFEMKEFDRFPWPKWPRQSSMGAAGGEESTGTELEQRLQNIESSIAELTLFIENTLRPDLGKGGLANE